MNEWISVDEALPERNKSVLFCYWVKHLDFPLRRVGHWSGVVWYTAEIGLVHGVISHWCELPSRDGLVKPIFDEEEQINMEKSVDTVSSLARGETWKHVD